MPQTTSALGADRWNAFQDAAVKRYFEMKDFFVERLMADGHPPFTQPNSPYLEFLKLLSWRMSGDPRFVNDPVATARFNQLSMQYGRTLQNLNLSPLGGQTNPLPVSQARAASQVAQAQWRASQPP